MQNLNLTSGGGLQITDPSAGSSAAIPAVLRGSLARTDTSAKALGVIPANSIITAIRIYAAAASNAGTTATLSLGKSGGTGTEYLNGHDVKTTATGAGQVNPNGGVLGSIGTANITLTGIYAETGSASNAGGPWSVYVEYIVP